MKGRSRRRRRCFEHVLNIVESDTGVPQTRTRRCAQSPFHAEEGTAVQTRTAKTRLELETPTRHSQGQRRSTGRGPILPSLPHTPPLSPNPRPSPPTHSAMAGSGMAQVDPSHAQTLTATIPVGGATSTGRGHSWPRRQVSRVPILLGTSIPSFDGFPGQSRRSLRLTHMLYPPQLTQTTTPL